jgi:hypothetical protein
MAGGGHGDSSEGALVGEKVGALRAGWWAPTEISSRVRAWAKLDHFELGAPKTKNWRFGFRRHYRVAPWTDFMELYWGRHCQVYVTPVSREEVGVALISSNPKLRRG